jgi:hypothetical protein
VSYISVAVTDILTGGYMKVGVLGVKTSSGSPILPIPTPLVADIL